MSKLKFLTLVGITLLALIYVKSTSAQAVNQKITICHRTNSVTNPYTSNTVDISSVDGSLIDNGNGDHTTHTGPVFDPNNPPPPPHNGAQWGDIIPAYTWPTGSYPGLNWPAGQNILNNGCNIVLGDHHSECQNNACVLIAGAGTNKCSTDSDCQSNNNPTPTPTPGNPGGGGSGGGSGTFVCTTGQPGTSSLVSVVKNGPDSVKLTWTAVSDATDYKIEYGLAPNNYIYGVPSTGNVTSYVVGALDLSKSYYFRVISVNGCAQGNPSNENQTAFGGPIKAVLGLSNTSSSDNSIVFLAGAIAFLSSGMVLLLKR